MWKRSSDKEELRQLLRSAYRHIDLLNKGNMTSSRAETIIGMLQGEVYVLQWQLRDATTLLRRAQPLVREPTIAKQIDAFLAQQGDEPPTVPGGLAGYEEGQQKSDP
jgi:hypothetical protein